MNAAPFSNEPRRVGRYLMFEEIAHGGMATVHIGRLTGEAGFKRTVAIKRLHPQYARNPEFVEMFLEEARLAARIQHPNVVSVLDIVAEAGELFLVMEYVHGESLSHLLQAAQAKDDLPAPGIVAQITTGLLYGLHAAHEARSDRGAPLEIVHRDVSPQNVLVGVEGVARVLDFGVAKAVQKARDATAEGVVRGKMAYMAPEQISGDPADRRLDVYAAAVVLWEGLTGRRLYEDMDMAPLIARILTEDPPRPSSFVPGLPAGIDDVVMKGLARDRNDRYATAQDMAQAIEGIIPPVPIREVSTWVRRVVDERLRNRSDIISRVEKISLPPPRESSASIDLPQGNLSRAGTPWGLAPGQAAAHSLGYGEGAAEVSGTSMIGGAEAQSSRRRRLLMIVVGSCILALLLLLVAVGVGSRGTAPGPAASSSASRVPASAAGLPESSGTTSAQPPPVLSATAAPSTEPSAAASTAHSAAHTAGLPTPTQKWTPPPPKRNCDPPWTIDARGVRVLKRECL